MTNATELAAGIRTVTGKASHKLAKDGQVPAIVYGRTVEPVALAVDRRELERLLHHAAVGSTLIDLKIDGQATAVDVIIKEVKHDEVKGVVQHVDFWAVDMGATLQTAVAITFVGSAAGEREGGTVMHALRELKVEARPKDLPEHIEVDVSHLGIGDSMTVADLAWPAGVVFLEDPETLVASVAAPRVEVEEAVGAEEITEVPEIGKEAAEEE